MTRTISGRVLFFFHAHTLGGVEKQSISLLNGLAPLHDLYVFVYEPWLADYIATSITSKAVPMGKKIGGQKSFSVFLLTAWMYALRYVPILWTNKPQKGETCVLFVHTLNEKFILTPLAKIFGYTIVWIEHGPVTSWIKGLPILLHRWFSRFVTKIITVSASTKNSLIEEGLPADTIEIIPNGVAVVNAVATGFTPITTGHRYTLVCIGRIVQQKGQRILLDAVQKLQARIPNIDVRIVGDGEDFAALKTYAKHLGIEKLVTFTGWVQEPASELAHADIFINPSLYDEGFGLTLIEAMMAKIPVIASRCAAHSEILAEGKTGILFTPGSVEELMEAILHVFNNPQEAVQLSKKGYAHAFSQYSESGMISRYSKCIESLMIS